MGIEPRNWQLDVAEVLYLELDTVCIAGTGSGKTLPFVMVLLADPTENSISRLRAQSCGISKRNGGYIGRQRTAGSKDSDCDRIGRIDHVWGSSTPVVTKVTRRFGESL